MPLVLADRVRETTTTTGQGTITLAGAVTGFQSFSVIGNGNTTYYTIAGQGTSEWEVGIGTYTSAGTTLSRDTVLASSAGAPTKTTFSAGTKDVFVTYPAGKSVYEDASDDVSLPGNFTLTGTTKKFQADFSNGTVNNRLLFQTSTANSATGIYAVPNGSSTAASWQATNNADTTNASKVLIATNGSTDVQLVSGINGTGTYLPLTIFNGGVGRFVFGTSGQFGIGPTATVNYGTSGQIFTSGGPSAAPSWITTVPVANGGTGANTLTANNVILGNGTSAVQFVAPGTNGNVLTSNGTTWTSAASAGFPAGTAMLFVQTSAPTGWTKSTTHNNKALRVVSGTASSGGTVAFTTAFASQAVSGTVGTSGATTLAESQIPAHTHTPIARRNTVTFTDTPSGIYGLYSTNASGTYGTMNTVGNSTNTGGGGSHTHSGGTFTGTAIDLAVQYVDVIIATKD